MRSVLPVAITALTCSTALPTVTASAAEVELIFVARVNSVQKLGAVGWGTKVGDHILVSYTYDDATPTSTDGLGAGLYFGPALYAPLTSGLPGRYNHYPHEINDADGLTFVVDTRSFPDNLRFDFTLADRTGQALDGAVMPGCIDLGDWDSIGEVDMRMMGTSPFGSYDDVLTLDLVGQIRGYCDGFDRPFAVAEWCTLDTDLATGTQTIALDASRSLGNTAFFFWRPLTPGSPMPADDNTPDATVDLTPGTHVYEVVVATTEGWDSKAQVEIVVDAPPETCAADVNGDGSATPADFTAWLAAFNIGCP